MLQAILWFLLGLIALIAGAELVVRSASRLAVFFGISKLIIGLTVVAFGTSAPELAVSIQAGVSGQTDLMLGNIIGSNLSNILLILGVSAIIIPLKVNSNLIKIDVPIMISVTVILFIFALNGSISFTESLILSFILGAYLILLAKLNKVETSIDDETGIRQTKASLFIYLLVGIVGLSLLISGAGWLVESAIIFAEMAGVSELIIGLTIVAIGTSLPELVTSIVAAIRGERDIAVGSIVGSNILNILAVLGISGLFIPGGIPVQDVLLRFDLLILIAVSFACIPIFFTGHLISRWEGILFLIFYTAYIGFLFLQSAEHHLIELFSNTMLLFVIPITVITIFTVAYREWKWRQRFKGFGKK